MSTYMQINKKIDSIFNLYIVFKKMLCKVLTIKYTKNIFLF